MTVRQATLAHEAGHVVGGLIAGHRIEKVRLGPTEGEPNNSGTTRLDWVLSPGVDLYGHLVAMLMGPMAAGKQAASVAAAAGHGWLRRRTRCSYLGQPPEADKAECMAAVALASDWLADPLVKSAIAKVAHALGQTGFLTDVQVRDVFGRGLAEWLELADPPAQSEELAPSSASTSRPST